MDRRNRVTMDVSSWWLQAVVLTFIIGFGILGYLAIRIYREADGRAAIPADLATEYIVTTFIFVLNWWVESRSRLSAREVDDVFLALVVPALTSAVGRSLER